jgi:hypothetical protein
VISRMLSWLHSYRKGSDAKCFALSLDFYHFCDQVAAPELVPTSGHPIAT